MAIPIEIKKITEETINANGDKKHSDSFLIYINDKNDKWKSTFEVKNREDLLKLRDNINGVLDFSEVSKKLKCSLSEAEYIHNFQLNNRICRNCIFKNIHCIECIEISKISDLEQKLFIALKEMNLDFTAQQKINKEGKIVSEDVDIITIPDFVINTKNKKLCVYVDSFSFENKYSYRNVEEEDAFLLKNNYNVLHFSSEDVKNNIYTVKDIIRKHM